MRNENPLFHEELLFTQHRFQQLDRRSDFASPQMAVACREEPSDTLGVEVVKQVLAAGRLKLTRLKLYFPEGTLANSAMTDALAPGRGLAQGAPTDERSLTLEGHPLHIEPIDWRADILQAKSGALGARSRERLGLIVEYGVTDVRLFWLLRCVHTMWPQLQFLSTHPGQSPERLHSTLAQPASVLMTFSTGSHLADLLQYDHGRADEGFASVATLIRDLLDAIISSRVVSIGLTHRNPATWAGQFLDKRIVESPPDRYRSVTPSSPAFQLVEQLPRLCKIVARDIRHMVDSEFPAPASPSRAGNLCRPTSRCNRTITVSRSTRAIQSKRGRCPREHARSTCRRPSPRRRLRFT
jgi:predicted component of type VI protein secretion system